MYCFNNSSSVFPSPSDRNLTIIETVSVCVHIRAQDNTRTCTNVLSSRNTMFIHCFSSELKGFVQFKEVLLHPHHPQTLRAPGELPHTICWLEFSSGSDHAAGPVRDIKRTDEIFMQRQERLQLITMMEIGTDIQNRLCNNHVTAAINSSGCFNKMIFRHTNLCVNLVLQHS